MLEILMAGGWAMLPIVVCSAVALAIILERFWSLRRKAVELSIPCITAVDTANALVDCLRSDHDLKNIPLVDIATLYHKK